MDHTFWKGNTEDSVKLLGSNVLKPLSIIKITKADLHKIGLKMRE